MHETIVLFQPLNAIVMNENHYNKQNIFIKINKFYKEKIYLSKQK